MLTDPSVLHRNVDPPVESSVWRSENTKREPIGGAAALIGTYWIGIAGSARMLTAACAVMSAAHSHDGVTELLNGMMHMFGSLRAASSVVAAASVPRNAVNACPQ